MKRNILRCFMAYILSILLLSNGLEVFASTLTNGAKITSETEERSDTVISKATDSNAKEWEFTYFGPSTSTITNTVNDDADIDGEIILKSATYKKDGSINKKGGKFVSSDPADGISFYYTKIDPSKENFILEADVKIDYMNPKPDGQEGFALMVRDSIGEKGDPASSESNLVSIGATQLPKGELNSTSQVKDMLGVRAYTGIDNKIKPNADTFKVYRLGFDKDGGKVSSGDTYRVRLEKNSSSYVVYQLAMDGSELYKYEIPIQAKDIRANSISGYEELNDPMNVQDRFAYVGFAVARGMNVTYSNIKFEKSEFDANDWRPQESRYIDLQAKITSPDTAAEENYTLVFKANANGSAKIYQDNVLKDSVEVVNNEELKKDYDLSAGKNFSVEFTPKVGYEPEPFVKLKSYETVKLNKSVSLRTIGKDSYIYVSNAGLDENDGSGYDNAISLESAIKYAKPGQTILLKPEVYDMSNKSLIVQKGRNGREDNPIRIQGDGGFATLDFKRSGKGFSLGGDYWELKQFNIINTADGYKGLGISGSHNIAERLNLFNNGTTGLQISGSSEDSKDKWPSYNYILNCTSMNNADSAMEDADGFAAKITSGVGNVFDGCIAAYNADDGWDLFAKVATGSIGDVIIKNSVAYRNGYILIKNGGNKKNFEFAPGTVDEYGNLSFEKPNIMLDAGNGNGFKMGGSNVYGAHKLDNSISYENKAKGIDSNSGPNIKISNSTSYNNGSYNVALYTSDKTLKTEFSAKGILSFRKGTNIGEQLSLQSQPVSDVMDGTNFYWNKDENISKNTASKVITVDENDFINLDTENDPKRNEDGKIDMNGLLLLKPEAKEKLSSGAGGRAFGEDENIATVWVVGDSTVSGFNDNYYIPRVGYGEELKNYLNAEVYNLAVSGASSKDFTTMKNYDVLLNGNSDVPKLGDGDNEKFLIIGFGHNDEKSELSRYTDPNSSYENEGSFANSVYKNYVKPALERGVTPIIVTPIARLTDDNTSESYNSPSGHITNDVVVGNNIFKGGDYRKALIDMSNQLGLEYIDLTEKTIDLNIEMGNDAIYLYAYTGAKKESDNLVPKGLDKTHTNLYGAKRNAYLIANADTTLKKYSKKREYPVKEDCFEDAINKDYKVIDYITPTEESKNWPEFLDVEGNVFTGSVFGNVGGEDKITGGDFEVFKSDKSINLTVKNNRGKIASNVDGIMMYYKRLPANTEFTLKAKVKINDIAKNDQVSFGLMARDDMYVDRSITDSIGDYVVAGSRMQGKINGFGRKNSKLYDGGVANIIYQKGDELDLVLTKTQDGYMVKYGENEPVSAGFDYPLTQIDSEYIYVGFFVARNANITFSDVSLKLKDNVDNEKNKAGDKIIPDTPSKNNNITEEKSRDGLPNDGRVVIPKN